VDSESGRELEAGGRSRGEIEKHAESEQVCSLNLGVAQTREDAVATRCDTGITYCIFLSVR